LTPRFSRRSATITAIDTRSLSFSREARFVAAERHQACRPEFINPIAFDVFAAKGFCGREQA
jgi:hypothetical protein